MRNIVHANPMVPPVHVMPKNKLNASLDLKKKLEKQMDELQLDQSTLAIRFFASTDTPFDVHMELNQFAKHLYFASQLSRIFHFVDKRCKHSIECNEMKTQ